VANLVINPDELRPLVRDIVEAVLGECDQLKHLLNGKLAVDEAEAAALLGLNPWQLRDLRLANRITHSRIVGGRIRYTHDDLVGYLRSTREPGISSRR
jgi:hypothetical protein